MGSFGGSKSKAPKWAVPYLQGGLAAANSTYAANQPRLDELSNLAGDAFRSNAASVFGPNPALASAQSSAQALGAGALFGSNPGKSTYSQLQAAANAPSATATTSSASAPAPAAPSASPYGASTFNPVMRPAASYRGSSLAADPSAHLLYGMATNTSPYAGNETLTSLARHGGGINASDKFANEVAKGQYLNAQPSAGLYSTIMSDDYLQGNSYLDDIINRTNENVRVATNQRFGASGLGAGMSTALADVMSGNLAANESGLRYQNYNDAANRQLVAAGQSDSVWSGERGRMGEMTGLLASNANARADRQLAAAQALNSASQSQAQQQLAAAQALGGQYNAGQNRTLDFYQGNEANALTRYNADADRAYNYYDGDQNRALAYYSTNQDNALEAARAADAAQATQVNQMLQALGLMPELEAAKYAGYGPMTDLLKTAGTLPYLGMDSYQTALANLAGSGRTTTGPGLGYSLLNSAADKLTSALTG